MTEAASADTATTTPEAGPSATLAAISRRMVALIKEFYGKGPTHARTYHVGDVVIVLLHGGYTKVEQTLIADGQEQSVIDQREAFQDAMRPRFKQVIEEEMQREVVAFLSAAHHGPDINAELFVLASEPGDESSETGD